MSDLVRADRLRERVPSLPADFEADQERPLRSFLSHTEIQATALALAELAPHVDRAAVTADTTVADVLAWIDGAAPETQAGAARPPRGSYRSANARLRPLRDADVEALYYAALEPRFAHRWRFRGRTPSPEQFRAALFSPDTLSQFMVVANGDHEARGVGIVSAYAHDPIAGHCAVAAQRSAVGSERTHGQGLMIEGFFVFVQFLFDHFDLNKVYLELPEYNRSLIGGGADSILQLEGTLTGHYYYGDRLWDQHIYALTRTRWEEVAPAFRGEWPEGLGPSA